MTIPEAAVNAATSVLLAHGEFSSIPDRNRDNAEIAAIESLTAALPHIHPGVKVRGLVWDDYGPTAFSRLHSKEGLVRYTIAFCGKDSNDQTVYRWAVQGGSWSDPFYYLDDAKSAAQADFERRIRSQIEVADGGRAEALERPDQQECCRDCDGYNCDDGCAYPEPPTARGQALEEGFRKGVEAAAQKAAEMLVFADTTSTADREIPAAIRALANVPTTANAATDNLADRAENGSGVEGELVAEMIKHANKSVTLGGQNYKAILLEDALAVISALSSPAREEWLPIESAPKDGTPFLVFVPDDEFSSGTGIDVIWYDEGRWLFGANTPFIPANKPTHWRPLPLAPQVRA